MRDVALSLSWMWWQYPEACQGFLLGQISVLRRAEIFSSVAELLAKKFCPRVISQKRGGGRISYYNLIRTSFDVCHKGQKYTVQSSWGAYASTWFDLSVVNGPYVPRLCMHLAIQFTLLFTSGFKSVKDKQLLLLHNTWKRAIQKRSNWTQ